MKDPRWLAEAASREYWHETAEVLIEGFESAIALAQRDAWNEAIEAAAKLARETADAESDHCSILAASALYDLEKDIRALKAEGKL